MPLARVIKPKVIIMCETCDGNGWVFADDVTNTIVTDFYEDGSVQEFWDTEILSFLVNIDHKRNDRVERANICPDCDGYGRLVA